MSGSCRLDRVSNVKIGLECQILVYLLTTTEFYNLAHIQGIIRVY